MADYHARVEPRSFGIVEELLQKSMADLSRFEDFRDEQKGLHFRVLVVKVLEFLDSRMNMDRDAARFSKYLFVPQRGERQPLEYDLQADFADFLRAAFGTRVSVEIKNVAGGRTDIELLFQPWRYVIETKKDSGSADVDTLVRSYGGQATEYGNTNVRLGVLLVLDLTPKPHGVGDIRMRAGVRSVIKPGDEEPRALLVAVVPGMRIPPSSVTAAH